MASPPLPDLVAFRRQVENAGIQLNTDATARAVKSADRWPEAAKWTEDERRGHSPTAVVRPTDTAQTAIIVAAANRTGMTLVPYGAGSGVVGAVTGTGHISLDLSGLIDEPHFDDEAGEVTAAAGVLAVDLETALNRRGRRLPHYPQSLHLASLGGLVATRSSGTFSSKYGNIEDFVVALEVVLPDGEVVRTRRTPRSSTGPDLSQLFIGSEGTLGVITSVTLRTLPQALDTRFGGVAFDSMAEALTAVRAVTDAGITPAVIRLYDPDEAVGLFQRAELTPDGRCLLILGFDGHPTVVAAEQATAMQLITAAGGTDLGGRIGRGWEQTRYNASWLERGNAGDGRIADAIEVAAAWPVLEDLHNDVLKALEPHTDSAFAHLSHFYSNGAAIYFIFFIDAADHIEARRRYRQAWESALEQVHNAGGSISHHHGIGEIRRDWMAAEHGTAMRLLRDVKQALDPNHLLCPGKLVTDERTSA